MGFADGVGKRVAQWKAFSNDKLSIHWEKHGREFGAITKIEYLKKAKEFAVEVGDFKEKIIGNFIINHDPKSGRVFIGHHKNREIRTFYIDDGRSTDPFLAAIKYAENLSKNA